MDTRINYEVFDGEENFPVDESLLDNITEEQRQLLREMMQSGYYIDGLDVSRFLREDLTINLEKLELATTLAVTALEANSPEEDVTLKLRGLDVYYEDRGITGDESREREERTFLLTFISSIASEASKNDTLIVKYVS
jgi:hypothetical protein